MMLESLSDPASFARWFGTFNSTPKYGDMDWQPETPVEPEDVRASISEAVPLLRNPASRMVFIANGDDALMLFADGACIDCVGETSAVAKILCAQDSLGLDVYLATNAAVVDLLTELCNMGCIAFESEE
jgi:50S ribosomal protein L16 3-hydroxylase